VYTFYTVSGQPSITVIRKWDGRYQDGGSGRSTGDPCAAKRMGREGPGPIGNLADKGGKR
jgi:hypothetical protein